MNAFRRSRLMREELDDPGAVELLRRQADEAYQDARRHPRPIEGDLAVVDDPAEGSPSRAYDFTEDWRRVTE